MEERYQELRDELSAIKGQLRNVELVLEAIKVELKVRVPCPAPGKCLELVVQNQSLSARVEALEQFKWKLVGMVGLSMAVISVLSPWLMRLFIK